MTLDGSSGGGAPEGGYDAFQTPYEVDESDFPSFGTLQEQERFLLRYAILAPSSHNTQPWKVALSDAGIAVYADAARRLPVADPGDRELFMSIGAFLMNLRIAAAHFGFEVRTDYEFGGDFARPVARVRLTPHAPRERVAAHLGGLFRALPARHTNRSAFLVTRIPQHIQDELVSLGRTSQLALRLSCDGAMNERVADLVASADRTLHADPSYRTELAEWVRPNWTRKPDGITGAAFGVGTVASAIGPWATRRLDMGRVQAIRDKNLCARAPLLAVIEGEDTVAQHIEAGELLERIWLRLTAEGLSCSFFNVALEVPDLRLNLRTLLGLRAWPQLLLRIGYSLNEPARSPRRPVDDIITGLPGR